MSVDSKFIEILAQDFGDATAGGETPFSDEIEYMRVIETKFLLKNIRESIEVQLIQAYSRCETITSSEGSNLSSSDCVIKHSGVDRQQLYLRRAHLDIEIKKIIDHTQRRLQVTRELNGRLPRIVQLIDKFSFSDAESDLYHLMVVVQGSTNSLVLNSLKEEDFVKKMTGYQRLTKMSEVDIEIFCDSDRLHVKEGLLLLEEDQGIHYNLRVPRTAVQVFYGRKMKPDELLKIAQTTLETILQHEWSCRVSEAGGREVDSDPAATLKLQKRRRLKKSMSSSCGGDDDAALSSASRSPRGSRTDLRLLKRARRPGTAAGGPLPLVRVNSELSWKSSTGDMTDQDWSAGGGGGDSMEDVVGDGEDDDNNADCNNDNDNDNDYDDDEIYCNKDNYNNDNNINNSDGISGCGGEYNDDGELSGAMELLPFPCDNQLEYLEEGFQLVALMVRGNSARIKDDMKKEGAKVHTWDIGEVKQSRRELQAKVKLHEMKLERRITRNRALSVPLPRLEVIAERLGLDHFEKKIILLLIGKTVSPVVKTLIDTLDSNSRGMDDILTVGQTLAILCQDFQTQIANRKYFYKSSKLMSNGIISLTKMRWHQGPADLTDNRVLLDRRVLDWSVGLDSEINEIVEGSDLYEPQVDLSQVVLPAGHLEMLLTQCLSHDAFCKYRETNSVLRDKLSYGNSLVVLLCGKSGTGKTMTVNALAKQLGKKVLLVDFGSLTGKRSESSGDGDADLRGLFREAHMSNAVLFFDECENVFRSRAQGADRLLNSLLTEIERHCGIVFLATNRPYDLDEAMHRRITAVIEYRSPDHVMRRKIWQNLLGAKQDQEQSAVLPACSAEATSIPTSTPASENTQHSNSPIKEESNNSSSNTSSSSATPPLSLSSSSSLTAAESATCEVLDKLMKPAAGVVPCHAGLQLCSDVDISAIAVKYELTGGFIKNAVLSALLSAISRDKINPIICQEDLICGCKLQMRGSLTEKAHEDKIVPNDGIDTLVLTKDMRESLNQVIRFEKARSRVYGSWSAEATSAQSGLHVASPAASSLQKACITVLAGPAGSGKKTLVKAVSYDLGRAIKMVHVADLLSAAVGDAMTLIQSIVQDARLADSVIVIDGFENMLDDNAASGEGGWKLHLMLSRLLGILYVFPGCVMLICHIDNPQNIMLQRDFASKLFSFARMVLPPADSRAKLWEVLLPARAPVAKDVSFIDLGRRFELYPGGISSALARASAEAAMRTETGQCELCQKDLLRAGEAEVAKLKSVNFEMMSKLFA